MPCTASNSAPERIGPPWTSRASISMASMTALLGNLVDGAAIAVGRCRIEARSEGTPDRLDVAGAGGVEYAVAFG